MIVSFLNFDDVMHTHVASTPVDGGKERKKEKKKSTDHE